MKLSGVVVVGLLLAGCGGGGDGTSSATPDGTAALGPVSATQTTEKSQVVANPAPTASSPAPAASVPALNASTPTPAASAPAPAASTPTPAASVPVAAQPVTAIPGWTLIWADEFDVDGLPDSSKWGFDIERNKLGWYNNEKQYYSANRLENSSVQGGYLTITARKESLSTAADWGGQAYTSVRMITRGKAGASWTYGLMKVRAKLPCSVGTWPAIWMLGTGGVWPDDGEIDIMEQRGAAASDKNQVLGTVHNFASRNGLLAPGVSNGSQTTLLDACKDFHDYQLTWSADSIQIGIDGNYFFQYLNPKDGDYRKWPFSKPQYMILNLAMGGDLGGAIPGNFVSDQMVIDYVRVYQKQTP